MSIHRRFNHTEEGIRHSEEEVLGLPLFVNEQARRGFRDSQLERWRTGRGFAGDDNRGRSVTG